MAEKFLMSGISFLQKGQFIAAGVDLEIAERDVCRIEHAISQTPLKRSGMHTTGKKGYQCPSFNLDEEQPVGENMLPTGCLYMKDNHRPFLFSPVHHFSFLSALMHRSMYRCDFFFTLSVK